MKTIFETKNYLSILQNNSWPQLWIEEFNVTWEHELKKTEAVQMKNLFKGLFNPNLIYSRVWYLYFLGKIWVVSVVRLNELLAIFQIVKILS